MGPFFTPIVRVATQAAKGFNPVQGIYQNANFLHKAVTTPAAALLVGAGYVAGTTYAFNGLRGELEEIRDSDMTSQQKKFYAAKAGCGTVVGRFGGFTTPGREAKQILEDQLGQPSDKLSQQKSTRNNHMTVREEIGPR